MNAPLLFGAAVIGFTLLGVAAVLLPFALWEHQSVRRHRVRREAARYGCGVRSVRIAWFPFFSGPFAGELLPKGCVVYHVRCRDAGGEPREAFVAIGPRRQYGDDEVVTWRWVGERPPRRDDPIP